MSEFTLIEASNGAKPKVVGVAYSGGKMNLPGWRHPVVVDLAGMEIPESVPLLTNHENKTDSRIGLISATVRNNVLEITGEIVSDSKDAADIIAQGKAGADWQLSIGADVKECELVKGSREVNGQEVEGPFYHIKKSTLREVSVVAVGADAHTNMKVNAKFNLVNQEGEAMNNKSETKSVSAVSTPNDAVPPEKKPEPEQKPGEPTNKPGDPERNPITRKRSPDRRPRRRHRQRFRPPPGMWRRPPVKRLGTPSKPSVNASVRFRRSATVNSRKLNGRRLPEAGRRKW